VIAVLVLALAAFGASRTSVSDPVKEGTEVLQDVSYLDRRISGLEQRLNLIESNVNRLQQDVMFAQRASPTQQRDTEIQLLRSEIELLKIRLREIDCGLVRLDERTLSPASKEARKRAATTADPCRQNAESPIQLSTHP
jgi:predicted RNase H-like nuclease (RuvC/YqgF family)